LVNSYISYLSPRIGVEVDSISISALAALVEYNWPGNVRELINVLERAMLLSDNGVISLSQLPEGISRLKNRDTSSGKDSLSAKFAISKDWFDKPWKEARNEIIEMYEREYFNNIVKSSKGRIAQAADKAGMTTRALYDKMQSYGIRKEQFRD
ncbi:MAG: hypothetical protein JXR97_15545, partial [Planctomycetes bacterium]|nr:hypothetical protein [Planctomycetota bacterium]